MILTFYILCFVIYFAIWFMHNQLKLLPIIFFLFSLFLYFGWKFGWFQYPARKKINSVRTTWDLNDTPCVIHHRSKYYVWHTKFCYCSSFLFLFSLLGSVRSTSTTKCKMRTNKIKRKKNVVLFYSCVQIAWPIDW